MTPSIALSSKHLWFNAGWYPGDPFQLFCLAILETTSSYCSGKVDHVIVFSIQVIKFAIAFGWRA